MKARKSLLALTALVIVAGCGSSGAERGTTVSHAGGSSSSSHDQAAASKALIKVVDGAIASRYIGFTFAMNVGGTDLLTVNGTIEDQRGWKATATFNGASFGEKEAAVLDVRAYRGKLWMQMRQWKPPSSVCWLPLGATDVPVGIMAFRPAEPGYVTLLADLRSTGWLDQSHTAIAATAPLDAVAQLLPGQTLQALGVDANARLADDRLPIEIRTTNGRLTGFRIEGNAILDALESAGYASDKVRLIYKDSIFSGTYTLGARAQVSPPARAAQVDVPPDQARSCPLSRR